MSSAITRLIYLVTICGVSADHCGVTMGVFEAQIDSVGAANRWRDRMGRVNAEELGSAIIPVRISWTLLVSGSSPRRC